MLETLESARTQTYKNKELIISDDGSTDETIDICRDWMKEHQSEFIRAELITSDENTGIPANCNRGVRASTGEWVKLIAGDDYLFRDAIEKFIDAIATKPCADVCFTNAIQYFDRGEESFYYYKPEKSSVQELFSEAGTAKAQWRYLVTRNPINASTLFFRRSILMVYPFIERYRYIEDRPMYMQLTSNGVKLHFVEMTSTTYRIHDASVQNHSEIFRPQKLRIYPFFKEVMIPHYNRSQLFISKVDHAIHWIMIRTGAHKNKFLSRVVNFFVYRWVEKARKKAFNS